MKKKLFTLKYRLICAFLLPLTFVASYLLSFFPTFVERYYARGVFRIINQPLSLITGVLPFSLGEFIVVSVFILIPIALIVLVARIIRYRNRIRFLNGFHLLLNITAIIGVLYFIFIFIWGFNYHRVPFGNIVGLKVEPTSVVELKELCRELIIKGNGLREEVKEDENGVMTFASSKRDALKRSSRGYENAQNIYPILGGTYGRPKGVLLSEGMSYLGISGIYFPFTGEANVNMSIPYSLIPATICHEMAHQRGFAREDEANYIAYVTSVLHPDIDFQYSGTLLAIIHSMNALYRYDPEGFYSLSKLYSDGIRRDLAYIRSYWQRYEGPVERASNRMNDAYLKSNMQEDGVHSYGRMVDLLIAEFKQNQRLISFEDLNEFQ